MRASSKPTMDTRQADVQNTARQPKLPDMNRAAGRASMIPVSTPAMTLPTVRPRRASGTRCATNGSNTCAAVAQTPIRNAATKKPSAPPDVAKQTKPSHRQAPSG